MNEQDQDHGGGKIPEFDNGNLLGKDFRDRVFDELSAPPREIPIEGMRGVFRYNAELHAFETDQEGIFEGLACRVASRGVLPAPLSTKEIYYFRRIGDDSKYFALAREQDGPAISIQSVGVGEHWFEPRLRLRKFSFATFRRAAKDLNLQCLVGSNSQIEEIPGFQLLEEVMMIGWMSTVPEAEVADAFLRLDLDPLAIKREVALFEGRIPFDDEILAELMNEVFRVVFMAKKTWFRMLARAGRTGGKASSKSQTEDPPGNF